MFLSKRGYIIREYIDLNTKMRAEAKTEAEKDRFKLLNNSLFGKNCEFIKEFRKEKIKHLKELKEI